MSDVVGFGQSACVFSYQTVCGYLVPAGCGMEQILTTPYVLRVCFVLCFTPVAYDLSDVVGFGQSACVFSYQTVVVEVKNG